MDESIILDLSNHRMNCQGRIKYTLSSFYSHFLLQLGPFFRFEQFHICHACQKSIKYYYRIPKITSQYFHCSNYQIQRSHHATSDIFLVLSDVAVKGSSDQIHYIFENNVGKSRIRHTTTPKLNFKRDSNRLTMVSFKFRLVIFRIRLFPTMISNMKQLGSELPLNGMKH